jgi:hypothetical protein
MKLKCKVVFLAVLALAITGIMTGCATGPKPVPQNESPVELLALLEKSGDALRLIGIDIIPSPLSFSLDIPVVGKSEFEFDGDMWYQKVKGEYSAAGFYTLEGEPKALTLTKTHFYRPEKYPIFGNPIGWKKESKEKAVFTLMFGSPPSFKL